MSWGPKDENGDSADDDADSDLDDDNWNDENGGNQTLPCTKLTSLCKLEAQKDDSCDNGDDDNDDAA